MRCKYTSLNNSSILEPRRFTLVKKSTLSVMYGRVEWYLFIYLSIRLSVCLFFCLSVYRSICLSIYLSIYLSISLSVYLSSYLYICLSIHLSICLHVSGSILFIYLSIYLSTYLLIYPSVYLSLYYVTVERYYCDSLKCYSTMIDRKSCCRKRIWIREKEFAVWTWIDETT